MNDPLARAMEIPGWMTVGELSFLVELARSMPAGARIVEVGSWKGRSTVAICAAVDPSARVFAVDTFQGDPLIWSHEGTTNKQSLRAEFHANTRNYPFLSTIEGTSREAAKRFNDRSLDWVFIDADHRYESVVTDIYTWAPKLKRNGLLSGHDLGNYGVTEAVLRSIGPVHNRETIWFTRGRPRSRGQLRAREGVAALRRLCASRQHS